MRKKTRHSTLRSTRFEKLEERLALSAQALASLAPADAAVPIQHFGEIAPVSEAPPLQQFEQSVSRAMDQAPPLVHMVEPDFRLSSELEAGSQVVASPSGTDVSTLLNGVHDLTGVNYAYETFGLTGRSQTVAVIDSGVGYWHQALGAGFGANHRVVGGWDFAENDADPYDDGPAGFHGTHVAGIVGSDHDSYRGVAPEADIVALRVFDDNGNGYFHWVEQALQWVHDHRNDFENPITAVNLSLGAEWNSDSIPNWANLEDEFAQLEADGIFISVAAGNSFANYNATGLAYPAVSPYVVPASSVNDNGLMSSFSQRSDRVLAAPGSSIISTVPDHVFGADGIHNDFGAASGTSMAAPYVAGASVLVREAMEFAGFQTITQDVIYDHLRDTADLFFDAATSANYHRINLRSAVDALIGADDYGSTANAAHGLGALSGASSLNGSIERITDADYFTFTAGASGEMTLAVAETHNLDVHWSLIGGGESTGDSLTFSVVAGQSYTFGVSTSDGIGHYTVALDLDAVETEAPPIDWGTVVSARHDGVQIDNASANYRLEASRDGLLTVEAFFQHARGNVDLELRDTQGNIVARSDALADLERVDVTALAGEVFTLHVSGRNSDVDFRLTNLVSLDGTEVSVHGLEGDDQFGFAAGAAHSVSVNGVAYEFNATDVTDIRFYGNGGDDAVAAHGSAEADTAIMRAGSFSLAGVGYQVSAESIAQIDVFNNGGGGKAHLHDTAGDDVLAASPTTATLSGEGYQNSAHGFSWVNAYASAGNDSANLEDSSGADRFIGRATYSHLTGAGYLNQAIGFDKVEATASAGDDAAFLYDSSGDDEFIGRNAHSYLQGSGFLNIANGFARVDAHSSGGSDTARLYDSAANDLFVGRETYSYMQTDEVVNSAYGFASVHAYSRNGGSDTARLYDSAGDDEFVGREHYSYLQGSGFQNVADGFDRVDAYASSGSDSASLYDSNGNDRFVGRQSYSYMQGSGFLNVANGFDRVDAYASVGIDTAILTDSAGNDHFVGRPEYAYMQGGDFLNVADGFDRVYAYASTGMDTVLLTDSAGNDRFVGRHSYAYMQGSDYLNVADGFDRVDAIAGSGFDTAYLYDTANFEHFVGRSTHAFLMGNGFLNVANRFDRVEAFSSGGGDTAELTDSAGNDVFYGRSTYAYMMGDGFINIAHRFAQVTAKSLYGGSDTAYLFGSNGDDSLFYSDNYSRLTGAGFDNRAVGFRETQAFGRGGNDTAVFRQLGQGDSLFGRNNYLVLERTDGDTLTIWDFADMEAEAAWGETPHADVQSVDYVFRQMGDWDESSSSLDGRE